MIFPIFQKTSLVFHIVGPSPNTCTTLYHGSVRDLQCAFGIKKSWY